MNTQIPNFENLRILVVGDVMLDRYWSGETSRISPEAPVPIVHVERIENRPGGAANVAVNLSALGCKVKLLGLVGHDEAGHILQEKLLEAKVECYFQTEKRLPTTTKLRVLGKNQQLIRLDFEEKFYHSDISVLLDYYKQFIYESDVIILSDYGKGLLLHAQTFIQIGKQANKPVFVDPKNQDFGLYQGATCITPNLKEFEMVVGQCHSVDDITNKGQALCKKYNLESLLVTRGAEGMTLLSRNAPVQHFKAHASEVYDVSGAGDTVISLLAATFAAGYPFHDAAFLANIAASIVVKKLGVATTSTSELRRALQSYNGSEFGILDEESLIIAVSDAKLHGEKIIMTNGCFDLLHVGHISYLEMAKSLGDRLIVAVNDDASVQHLKGQHRPINTLHDRMKMLAALRMIDWVVPFSEDTPERIISRVLPHILVKGGDYKIDEIAGGKQVMANGGEVKILQFVDGYSSSNLIEKIRSEEICTS